MRTQEAYFSYIEKRSNTNQFKWS